MNWIQQLKAVFVAPSADVLAVQELEQARRSLLAALTAKAYATAIVDYQTSQVARLTKTVSGI